MLDSTTAAVHQHTLLVISTLLVLLSVLSYIKGYKTSEVIKTYSLCHTLFRLPGGLGFVLWIHGESSNSV